MNKYLYNHNTNTDFIKRYMFLDGFVVIHTISHSNTKSSGLNLNNLGI